MLSLTCRSLKDYLGSKKSGLVVAKVQEGRRGRRGGDRGYSSVTKIQQKEELVPVLSETIR